MHNLRTPKPEAARRFDLMANNAAKGHCTPCINCGARPEFGPSGDPEWPVRLAHESSTCPAQFGLVAYAATRRAAIAQWESHVALLKAKRR